VARLASWLPHPLREELPAGFCVLEPAIVVEPLPRGMALEVGARGELIVTKDRG